MSDAEEKELGSLRARPKTAELPHQGPTSETVVLPKLYVGTMNDGLFIIDQPPRPAPTDYIGAGTDPETNVIATIAGNDRAAQARANQIVRACNTHGGLVEALKAMLSVYDSGRPISAATIGKLSIAARALIAKAGE